MTLAQSSAWTPLNVPTIVGGIVLLIIFIRRRSIGWSLAALGAIMITLDSLMNTPGAQNRIAPLSLAETSLAALGAVFMLREVLKDPISREPIWGKARGKSEVTTSDKQKDHMDI